MIDKWMFLYKRLTYRYCSGWAGEDLWTSIGWVRILRRGRKVWSEDGENYERTLTVAVRSSRSVAAVKAALADTYTFGCQCEHDCCGHPFCHYVDVRRSKGRREFVITQHVGHNC